MYGEYDSGKTHPSSQDEDSGHFRNTLPHTGKKKRASRLGKAGLKFPKHPEFKQLSLSESGEVHELTSEDSNSQTEPGITSGLSWLRETPVKNDEPIKSHLSPPFKSVNTIHRSTSIHTEKSSVISELISGSLPAGNLNTFPELKTEKPSNLSVPSWKRSLFNSCETKPSNILQDMINFDNNAHRTALSVPKLGAKNSVETELKVTDKENVIPKLFDGDKSSGNLFDEHKTKHHDKLITSHTVQTSNRSSQLIKEIIHENLNSWEIKRTGEHYHSTNNELNNGPASNEMHSFNLSKNKVLDDPTLPFDLRISSRMNSEHAYSCGPSVNSHSSINYCHKSDNSQKGFLPLSSSNDIVDAIKPCSVGKNVQTKHNFLPTNSLHVSKPVYNFFSNKSEATYIVPKSNHVSSSSNVFDNDKISNSGCNEFNKDSSTNIKSSPEIFTSNENKDKLSPLNVQTTNKLSPVKIQPVRTDDKQLSAIAMPSVSQQKPIAIPMPSVSQQKPIAIPMPSVSQQKPIVNPMPSVSQQKPTAIPMPSVLQQKPIMAPPSSTNTFKPPQSVLKTSRSTLLRTQSHNRFNPEYNVTNDSGKTISVNDKPYAILSTLGRGGSSEVYLVLEQETTKLKAIKCVNLSKVDKIIADGYLNEVELLLKLQGCESVIRMFDHEYIEDEKLLYVVMEKGDTDLSKLLREISKTKKVSLPMIIYYWTEMLSVVKDIHDQGIIHSDLKPANFLLVGGRLKLIDFGIASSLQGDMTSVQKEVTTGTWNYMSPEALKNNGHTAPGFKINYKSDVWSLGCILYNLVYGKTPFSHITKSWGKLLAIVDPSHVISFPETVEGRGNVPIFLLKTLKDCLTRDPKLRPSVTDLLNCPYYQITDDNNVENHTRKLKNEMAEKIKNKLSPENFREIAHIFESSHSTNAENSV